MSLDGVFTCQVILVFVTAALPAKALVIQYNGKYGCVHWEHEGVPTAVHLHRDRAYQENKVGLHISISCNWTISGSIKF